MRADRLISILLLLQARGRMSARSLAERLEVSQRTVYRDLEALGMAGVPVVTDRGPQGGAHLLDGYRTDLTGLTEPELRALLAFGGHGPAAELGLGPAVESASRKVAAASGPGRPPPLQQRVLIDSDRWWRGSPVSPHLSRVQDALWSDRRLRILYRRGEEKVVERVVEPFGLVTKTGTWYLLARVDEQLRVYRISRIEESETLPETFERPSDFNLATAWAAQVAGFWDASPIHIRVRADASVNGRLARIAGEHLIERAPGGEFVLGFPAVDAAAGFLAGFGDAVEALSPPALRERLAVIGRQLADLYNQP